MGRSSEAAASRDDGRQTEGAGRYHVAAVFSNGDIRFLAASLTPEGLTAQLAGYVGENAGMLLYPEAADEVRRMLAEGELARGVELYFERVGQRWEREQLRREVVAG